MKHAGLIALTLILILLGACKTRSAAEESPKPLIITTIHPYELLVKQMVGDAIEVKSLVPPNASVHTWSPQPADMADLNRADLVISNGMGLENFLGDALKNLPAKHLIASDMLKDLVALDSLNQVREELMHSAAHNDTNAVAEHHHHEGADPHLWTSPLMLQKLCTKLKNELVILFPDVSPVINHNHDLIIKELSAAHDKITAERAALKDPALLTYHNSFHYFTQEYQIPYLGWVQSSPGKEPSARDLAELGKKIREHQVKCIFIEPQQNDKAAQVLAKEYQMQIYTLDPLGGSLPVDSVSDLILANWKVMKQAFAQ